MLFQCPSIAKLCDHVAFRRILNDFKSPQDILMIDRIEGYFFHFEQILCNLILNGG